MQNKYKDQLRVTIQGSCDVRCIGPFSDDQVSEVFNYYTREKIQHLDKYGHNPKFMILENMDDYEILCYHCEKLIDTFQGVPIVIQIRGIDFLRSASEAYMYEYQKCKPTGYVGHTEW